MVFIFTTGGFSFSRIHICIPSFFLGNNPENLKLQNPFLMVEGHVDITSNLISAVHSLLKNNIWCQYKESGHLNSTVNSGKKQCT